MKHQALRPVALMLSFLLATAVPARAGTVEYADVVQVIVDAQDRRARIDLRLRALTQSGRVTTSSGGQEASSSALTNDPPQAGTPVTGTSVQTPQGGGNVQTVDLGDVTGTVCDCGEIPVPVAPPGGGFPLWPLLGLAAIPLAFLGGDEDRITPPPGGPGPTPTPPPPVVIPEPATILLLGSGLLAFGAGIRRRRRGNSLATDEAEVVEEI